jgi:hypothetical protein
MASYIEESRETAPWPFTGNQAAYLAFRLQVWYRDSQDNSTDEPNYSKIGIRFPVLSPKSTPSLGPIQPSLQWEMFRHSPALTVNIMKTWCYAPRSSFATTVSQLKICDFSGEILKGF